MAGTANNDESCMKYNVFPCTSLSVYYCSNHVQYSMVMVNYHSWPSAVSFIIVTDLKKLYAQILQCSSVHFDNGVITNSILGVPVLINSCCILPSVCCIHIVWNLSPFCFLKNNCT